jgi:hypothetical protein
MALRTSWQKGGQIQQGCQAQTGRATMPRKTLKPQTKSGMTNLRQGDCCCNSGMPADEIFVGYLKAGLNYL